MTRSNRRCAVATARKPHARALHAWTDNWLTRGKCKHVFRGPLRPQNVDSTASVRKRCAMTWSSRRFA
eukprot:11161187-Lingulodinium_polyedra.AAC.1